MMCPSDLLYAQQIGNDAYEKFQAERIEVNPRQFHDPLLKLKLKTFSHLKHQVNLFIKTNSF